jgi:N6-L-threonylcarbamoyladenine synthase
MIGAMAQIQFDKGDFAKLDLNADPSLDFDME